MSCWARERRFRFGANRRLAITQPGLNVLASDPVPVDGTRFKSTFHPLWPPIPGIMPRVFRGRVSVSQLRLGAISSNPTVPWAG